VAITMSSAQASGQRARAAAAGITSADIKVGLAYTGGKAGKATGTPIEVGSVVANQGVLAQPWLSAGQEAAVLFVNNYLDGIDGHPIKLVDCSAFGETAQQGEACGTQFANDSAIKAVLFAGGLAGVTQLHAANDGKKVYLCVLPGPSDTNVPNEFCTSPGIFSNAAVPVYLKTLHNVKTVAEPTPDDPTLVAVENQENVTFKKLGLTTKEGLAPLTSTNVTSAVVASGAQTADAVFMTLTSYPLCAEYARALKSLGIVNKPVISLNNCASSTVQSQLGGLPDWTFDSVGPFTELPNPQIHVFSDATSQYASQVGNAEGSGGYAPQTFGNVLLLTKIFNELGPQNLTTAAIAAKFKAYTGGMFDGYPHLKFGTKPYPSIGTLATRFYTHNSNGTWTAADGGKWIIAGG
jgi:branched-chain amino acid transport system substrate-binding protein